MTIGAREKRLLGVAAGVIALVVALRLWNARQPAVEGPDPRPATGAPRPAADGELADTVVDVEVASLVPREGELEIGRDPFRYGAIPTPPPPPPPPPPPVVETPQVVEVLPPPVYEPPKPQPPPIDHLRFLGSFGPERSKIAVIASGGEIYNVREGAVIEQQFVVQQIGYESVAIGFVNFPEFPPRRLGAGGFPGG